MKNYTSLEKMKASEVAPSFTEEKVTAETFPQEVAKGTLYKGFEPPKDATMLKFRYYSPDGTLIEQNNVPVVYDGTGIESVVTYYLLTDKKDGITLESDGWTDIVQTVTAEKRFLWTYTKTTYTNKAFACTDPCITAVFGEQGERGAMYLGHYASDQDAYEDNKTAVFTGDYYLNTTDSYLYEYNKENNIWKRITELTDYRYNQSINDIFEAINDTTKKEEFLKAKIAWVQNLSAAIARVQMLLANEIQLTSGKDLNGNNSGGIIRSSNYNGTTQNGKITKAGTAGWAIDYDGKAEFNNVTVRGTVDGSVVKGSTVEGSTINGGTITGSTINGGTGTFENSVFSKSCVFKGYTDQGLPTADFGFLHFRYRNNALEILEENFPLYNGDSIFSLTRVKTGVYNCSVRADQLLATGDNPLSQLLKDYPMKCSSELTIASPYENIFKTDGFQYIVKPDVIYASDSPVANTKGNLKYVGYKPAYHLNVHCAATYDDENSTNGIPIFWNDGWVNYGVVATTGFFDIPFFKWTLFFTDYNNDKLIDPEAGACMTFSFSVIKPTIKNNGFYS